MVQLILNLAVSFLAAESWCFFFFVRKKHLSSLREDTYSALSPKENYILMKIK